MLAAIKNIDPAKITDIEGLRAAVTLLINAVEQLLQQNEKLQNENEQLRDENSKLKGGNARPVIKGSAKATDISSKGREQGRDAKELLKHKDLSSPPIEIDQEIKVEIAPENLPSDAIFKGYVEYRQQDLRISRNNKKFLLATYYSALQRKTIQAPFPAQEIEGHFGPGIKSLVNILHHYSNVTHSCLQGLL